jgi:plasmid stabilization system protein ParE
MNYDVLVLPAAERDVYRILTWLGKRSENAPAIWFRRWEDVVKTLSENPERCGFAPENEDHPADIRQIIFRTRRGNAFRAIFTIRQNSVFILHVRGSGQRFIDSIILPDETNS